MSDSIPSYQDALDVYGFQRLYAGACKIDNPKHRFLACFIILMMGRLGLRIAELQHLREEWIDWDRGVIQIPERDPCACARCWLQAYDQWGRNGLKEIKTKTDWDLPSAWKNCSSEQRKKIVDKADCCTSKSLKQIVIDEQFGAKYDRSARTIPFGWSERLTCALMTFFDRNDVLDYTQPHINRLITKAAKNAEGIDESRLSAHNLRATGLTFIADTSVDAKMLRDIAGWEKLKTAVNYLRQSGRIAAHKMYHIMGRGDQAPDVVPGEPEYMFPVVMNPQPYQNEPFEPQAPNGETYDQECRRARADERRSGKLKVRNHRDVNIPDGRAAFPTEPELDFDITELDIPGHIDPDSDLFDAESGVVESRATTLTQYAGTHTVPNPREDRSKQWRAETYQESTEKYREDSDDTAYGSLPGVGVLQPLGFHGQLAKDRLALEWEEAIKSEGEPRPIHEKLAGAGVAGLMLTLTGIFMAMDGIYFNPLTMEAGAPPLKTAGLLMACTISTVNTLWTDYCCRIVDRDPYPRLASFVREVRDRYRSLF